MDIVIPGSSDLNPNLSEKDLQIHLANKYIERCMRDPEWVSYLKELKAEYLHDKGWSKGKTLKCRVQIPQDAVKYLPKEISTNTKELVKWVQRYHPYLMLDSL